MNRSQRVFESGRLTHSRREEGVALIVVMLILALVSVLAVSSMETTMRDQQVAGVQMRDRVAFQAAEAGLATALVSVTGSNTPTLAGADIGVPGDYPLGQPSYLLDPKVPTPIENLGVIVLDDGDCIVRAAKNINEFFHEESCGKCTPCREGLDWTGKILHRMEAGEGRQGDLEQLDFLCGSIFGNSFCALGDGAAWALKAAITQFRDEFVQHVEEGRCPFH